MRGRSRRGLRGFVPAVVLALATTACAGAAGPGGEREASSADVIKVGILHSLSGTMAISETSLRDAELLAIEEINAAGGVLGKKLVPVIEDGASDWPTFAEKAQKLISADKVATVFGCWTSASRKAVKPVFERLGGLLWYPVQYEGLEASPNIFYTGAAPNQQIVPAVDWLLEQGRKRMFLLGSDYVFPRTAHQIIKAQLAANGGELVGEEYTPLGHTDPAGPVFRHRRARTVSKRRPEGEPDAPEAGVGVDEGAEVQRHGAECERPMLRGPRRARSRRPGAAWSPPGTQEPVLH